MVTARPKGGKRVSRYYKLAAEERLAELFIHGKNGCRLAIQPSEINEVEFQTIKDFNDFNSLSKEEKLKALVKNLKRLTKEREELFVLVEDTLSERQRMKRKRNLYLHIIDKQIMEVGQKMDEILEEE